MTDAYKELNKKLADIREVFDVQLILAGKSDIREVERYYRINRWAYTLFHSRGGFIHMGLSRDGRYKSEDLLEPLKVVETYMKSVKAKRVLELGIGRGANSEYLAIQNPLVSFFGLDIPGGQTVHAQKRAERHRNLDITTGDFHNLDMFKDQSFDVVFVIEALCHSNKKRNSHKRSAPCA